MKLNCKPGDMARIIGPINTGSIVECIKLDDVLSQLDKAPWWEIRAAWPLNAQTIDGKPHDRVTEGYLPDSVLRPIRPPETPETTETTKELTA